MGAIITLHDINMVWNGRHTLRDVNLTVRRGDFMAITGPNGSGKTTLLRIMLRLLRPTTGAVRYLDPAGTPTDTLNIGYLPQKTAIDARFPITVSETIASGLLGKETVYPDKATRRQAVDDALRLVELQDKADAPIGTLSGGQLQRTLLGRALISRPTLLVLDEPLSYLDRHFEQQVYAIMEHLPAHTTVILVSHQLSVIDRMANRHIIVDGQATECSAHSHFITGDCQ